VVAHFPGQRLEGAVSSILSWSAIRWHSCGSRYSRAGNRGRAHRTRTRAGRLRGGTPIRHRTYCPWTPRAVSTTPRGRGRLPEEIIGKTVWQANPVVNSILRSRGALLADEEIEHSYPNCWRCHKPTIFRATVQWFIGMERNGLREKALEAIRRFIGRRLGRRAISNMIATGPTGAFRGRGFWGVPIIVFYCEPVPRAADRPRAAGWRGGTLSQHTADICTSAPPRASSARHDVP